MEKQNKILCWCNSGKEFKNCHLGRESATPLPKSEELKKSKHIWGKEYCLHPNSNISICNGGIIKAHTVQKSMLEKIAVKGHVYSPQTQLKNSVKELVFKQIGVNNASVFTGFCGFHDNETFKNIETVPFTGTDEQCFLYAYRAVCREVFLKRSQNEQVDFLKTLDAGKTFEKQQQHQDDLNLYDSGVDAGQREIENLKIEMDRILLANNFNEIHYCIFWLDNKPEILCSGIVQPNFDFFGEEVQDWTNLNKDLDGITLSMIATDSSGAVVFAWHKNSDDSCIQLIQSLISQPKNTIPNHIVNFIINNFENFYLSPVLWEGLDSKTQEIFKDVFMEFLEGQSSQYLVNNKINNFNWTITKITSNAFTVL